MVIRGAVLAPPPGKYAVAMRDVCCGLVVVRHRAGGNYGDSLALIVTARPPSARRTSPDHHARVVAAGSVGAVTRRYAYFRS